MAGVLASYNSPDKDMGVLNTILYCCPHCNNIMLAKLLANEK